MKHSYPTWKRLASHTLAAVLMAVMTACSSDSNVFEFENAKDAVTACRKELSKIRLIKNASMDELSRITSRWIALQDTTFAVLSRDTTIDANSDIAEVFFVVADSVRGEITRLALAEKRTMEDVVYFKIHTAHDREKIRQSKDYEAAKKFYAALDDVPIYKNKAEAVKTYKQLLKQHKHFKKEGELMQFIKEEDRCFRSVMVYLPQVTQEDLAELTDETARLFQQLYQSTQINAETPINGRVMLYISMRFNRRIIQNSQAVYDIIKKKTLMSPEQVANFRWMLLQPYLSIDNYSMAYITAEQEKILIKISEELPRLLSYIDGKDFDKSKKSETDKLSDVLTDYFLKSYLRQAL